MWKSLTTPVHDVASPRPFCLVVTGSAVGAFGCGENFASGSEPLRVCPGPHMLCRVPPLRLKIKQTARRRASVQSSGERFCFRRHCASLFWRASYHLICRGLDESSALRVSTLCSTGEGILCVLGRLPAAAQFYILLVCAACLRPSQLRCARSIFISAADASKGSVKCRPSYTAPT